MRAKSLVDASLVIGSSLARSGYWNFIWRIFDGEAIPMACLGWL
jgi:hypothetical protein